MVSKRVCLVIGAGAGIGVNVARRFAKSGMIACLARRSNQAGLDAAVSQIEADGGTAKGYLMDTNKPGKIEELVVEIETSVGEIDVAVYNLGAQMGSISLQDSSLKKFELGWRMGCEGLFRLAKSVTPRMVERKRGCLLVTSATAALRGNKGQHIHAAAMGGRRMLCQTLAHELGPQGVHVCHIVVDGGVNAPDTLGRMLDMGGGKGTFETFRDEAGDRILQPVAVAETYFHVASQHRSVWTQELDLRPFSETPWYNSDPGKVGTPLAGGGAPLPPRAKM